MLDGVPVMEALKARMRYLEARQKLLAENVANANTPGFRPRDLKPFALDAAMGGAAHSAGTATPFAAALAAAQPSRTHERHLGDVAPGAVAIRGGAVDRRPRVFEATASGNAVNLEDEMMKLAQNQSDFQLASSLYQRGLATLKLALGKRA